MAYFGRDRNSFELIHAFMLDVFAGIVCICHVTRVPTLHVSNVHVYMLDIFKS